MVAAEQEANLNVDPLLELAYSSIHGDIPVGDLRHMVRVIDMEPGKLYRTTGKSSQYNCRVVRKPDPLSIEVVIKFYAPVFQRCWLDCEVPADYPVVKILDDLGHPKEWSPSLEVQTRGLKKGAGQVSGLGMMECWGLYFEKFIREPGGRLEIINAMVAEFPDKVDSINKWVDSYKSYYNLGRLPNVSAPAAKLDWIKRVTSDPVSLLEEK